MKIINNCFDILCIVYGLNNALKFYYRICSKWNKYFFILFVLSYPMKKWVDCILWFLLIILPIVGILIDNKAFVCLFIYKIIFISKEKYGIYSWDNKQCRTFCSSEEILWNKYQVEKNICWNSMIDYIYRQYTYIVWKYQIYLYQLRKSCWKVSLCPV